MPRDYSGMINGMYDKQAAYADKMYDADKKIAGQQYNQYRNEASVNSAKNLQALREQMANQGLARSGDNITGTVNINNQRAGEISKFNQEEQNTYDKYAQAVMNKKMELEMQRAKDLVSAQQYTDSEGWKEKQFNYQVSRDKVGDDRWNTQWQNTLAQQQWDKDKFNKQFDYQIGRDKVTDDHWNQQFNWDKDKFGQQMTWDKDKFGQQMSWDKDKFGQQLAWDKSKFSQQLAASASRGSGGSGYSLSSKKGNNMDSMAWDEFARQTQNGNYDWLEKNADLLKSSGVNSAQFNKMKNTLAEILKERSTQQRLNLHANDGVVYENRA